MSTPAFAADQRDTTTLRIAQIARVLRRHALLIGICGVIGAGSAFAYAMSLPKTFTASSSITVEGDSFAIPELQGAIRSTNAPDPMPWVRTEVQALTARGLVQEVIGKLGLEKDPEFNPSLRPPTFIDEAKAAVKSLLPHSAAVGPELGPDEAVLNAVQKSLSIFQDNRSLVIATAFTAQDPNIAAKFVNTLVDDYIQGRGTRRAKANRSANDTINDRVNEVKKSLDAIEQQMRDLRSRGDIVALRAGSVGQQQVEELASAAARASVDRATLEANWNRATALGKQGSTSALAGVLDSPTIAKLRDQESVSSSNVAQMSAKYGANYPAVRSARADLQSVQAQLGGEVSRIVASLGSQLRVARDKEADLQRQLSAARTVGVQAENARAQLDELQQEANTRRALYQTLLQREQQTVAQPAAAEVPDVRVLSTAAAPSMPSGPNGKLITGMGGLSGIVLGCLLALTRLRTVDGFDDPADVTRSTGMPVLGTLPRNMLRSGLLKRVLNRSQGSDVEALRALRARVRFAGRTGTPRCVLFTPGLGRGEPTDLAAAFARAAAVEGEKVLLIEANFNAPALARLFGVRSDALADVLQGGADWRDAVIPDPQSPLDLLLTDRRLAGANALLGGVPLQNLLVEARNQYDLVVLSGPAPDAADMQALALRADTTIIVLDAKSGNPVAQQAVSSLGGRNSGTLAATLVT